MAATRREFLSMGLIAGAGMALPGTAFASTSSPEAGTEATGALTPENPAAIAFTRGTGMYPGAPSENFQPELILDPAAPYRNLALLRPAYSSSAYDYNLTAQLVTDGLIDTHLPDWITTVVDGQILPKTEREIVVDHFESAILELPGSNPIVELHLGGGANLLEVDRMELFVVVPNRVAPSALTLWSQSPMTATSGERLAAPPAVSLCPLKTIRPTWCAARTCSTPPSHSASRSRAATTARPSL
jgi:hypothetical protein